MDALILAQDDCGWCADAKRIVARLATDYPLTWRVVDIGSAEGAALAASAGVLFPPAVFLDRQLVGYGRPSERRLRREIERRNVAANPP